MQKSKKDLFLELASPDKDGKSRWVYVTEFTGKYSRLVFGNGGDWCRGSSALVKEFKIETDKTITKGPGLIELELLASKIKNNLNKLFARILKIFIKINHRYVGCKWLQ